jgi:5'-deoxynucleotidase YfbR-like HD superfamily hydrolase
MNLTPRGSSILTASGDYVDPLNFKHEDFHAKVAIFAISQINRFTGHTTRPWSVGQHTLLVYRITKLHGGSTQQLMWALVHDMTEAYLGDMARPIKQQMPSFRDAEFEIIEAICYNYGLPIAEPKIVKDADNIALSIEALNLFPAGATDDWTMPDVGLKEARAIQRDFEEIDSYNLTEVRVELQALVTNTRRYL